jgi:hypothetical protein
VVFSWAEMECTPIKVMNIPKKNVRTLVFIPAIFCEVL